MVAMNRLTGHSPGFFSVYTLPPNQAVSVQSQKKINEQRNQTPVDRDVIKLILRKSRSLLSDGSMPPHPEAILTTSTAQSTPEIPDQSVTLVITSPPFLNIVQYAEDNWLRSWFAGIDVTGVAITQHQSKTAWPRYASWPALFARRGMWPLKSVRSETAKSFSSDWCVRLRRDFHSNACS
jgi:hypothetical protein